MNLCIFQPNYPRDLNQSTKTIEKMISWLDSLDKSVDLIVLPEYSNCPGSLDKKEFQGLVRDYSKKLLDGAKQAAKRCEALVFIGFIEDKGEGKYVNCCHMINEQGKVVHTYYKVHLTHSEKNKLGLDDSYLLERPDLSSFTYKGISYNMMICYDIYFPELHQQLVRDRPHIVIQPSYQRGDDSENIVALCKTRALEANAYFVHGSYAMGGNTGGNSLVAAPNGAIVANMGQKEGMLLIKIDPFERFARPSDFSGPKVDIKERWEKDRHPWLYRSSGLNTSLPNKVMPYPRLCAHRGLNTLLPENSLMAFAAAISTGVAEIELDLWPSKDGRLIVNHDPTLEGLLKGETRTIMELSYDQIQKVDIGQNKDPRLAGIGIPTFEQVLELAAHRVILNIHIKSIDKGKSYPRDIFQEIVRLIDKFDNRNHLYFAGEKDVLLTAIEVAEDIPRCCLEGQKDFTLIENAMEYGCSRVQFFKPYIKAEMVQRAKEQGLICNVFWADELEEAREYLDMGMDVILTNDCLKLQGLVSSKI